MTKIKPKALTRIDVTPKLLSLKEAKAIVALIKHNADNGDHEAAHAQADLLMERFVVTIARREHVSYNVINRLVALARVVDQVRTMAFKRWTA